jgi:hypothetical protein
MAGQQAYIKKETVRAIVKEATDVIRDIEGTLRDGHGVEGAAARAVRVMTWILHTKPFYEEHKGENNGNQEA